MLNNLINNLKNFFTSRYGVILLIGAIVFLFFNPLAFNQPTERTVVTRAGGDQFVRFEAGIYYAGFLAKRTEWPNQIGVAYKADAEDLGLTDNTVEIGKVTIQFSDGTTAKVEGIAQYILPTDEKEMIEMHNAHRTPEGLVKRRLAPYTMECLQSSAQLLSSEMHYSGGKAQMAQDYLNQLQNGSYLLKVKEKVEYDSIEKTNKRTYNVDKQTDDKGQLLRKFSSIKEYNIKVSDANIVNTDYETAVDSMLSKKINSSTRASISKQELMTAQQQKLTAEAQGEKKLVDIKYVQMQEQTKQTVAAQTRTILAEQNRVEQEIGLKADNIKAQRTKVIADADAYQKRTEIQANGALEQKIAAYIEVQKYWADAFSKYQGAISPMYIGGGAAGTGSNAWQTNMEITNFRNLRDLSLDISNKK